MPADIENLCEELAPRNNLSGASTPQDVTCLAERFFKTPLTCEYADGDWELGVPAVRSHVSVYIDFSGSDTHSGQGGNTAAQIGARRCSGADTGSRAAIQAHSP